MKLDYVEIAGFRGFRDKVRFDLPAGFVVFTGRNGVGKSTILDAIDFALTGTINKFVVKNARGGGLDEHLWWVGSGRATENFVTVGFADRNGEKFTITRSRSHGLQPNTSDHIAKLCSGNPSPDILMQTTLIRDESIVALSIDLPEQQRFAAVRAAIGGLLGVDHSKRTGEILRAATYAEDEQQSRLQSAQAELGRTLSALTEARSVAERSPDVSEAVKTIESAGIDLPPEPQARADFVRRYIAAGRQALQAIEVARRQSESLAHELSYIRSLDAARNLQTAESAFRAAALTRDQAQNTLVLAEKADAAEKEGDEFAVHLAAIIEHGEHIGLQDGRCPLCAAERKPQEFSSAIKSAKARLASRGERLAKNSKAVAEARLALDGAVAAANEAQKRYDDEVMREVILDAALGEIQNVYDRYSFKGAPDRPTEAQQLILTQQEALTRLERALYILEASSAIDRVGTLESKVVELRGRVEDETSKLDLARGASQAAKEIDTSSQTVANQILTEQFDTVMPLLKELYRRLRPHSAWTEIDSDFGGKVRASLNFTVGEGHNLQFLFSSGQRRAAGLAFLLAIHLSRRWCGWNSLLLDDPVQHIDDYRALNLVEALAAIRRDGRQVVIAVEDTALADLLCRRLRSGPGEFGRYFELRTSSTGSGEIGAVKDIFPMPTGILRAAQAS